MHKIIGGKVMNYLKKGSTLLLTALLIVSFNVTNIKAEENHKKDLLSNATPVGEWVETSNGVQFRYYDESMLQSKKQVYRREALPAQFDLRNQNLVTSVKDQGVTGTCWSFGKMSSIESNILKQGLATKDHLNLSERHLAWFSYHGKDHSDDKSLYAGNDTFLPILTWNQLIEKDPSYKKIEPLLVENGIDKDDFASYSIGGSAWNAAVTLSRNYGITTENKVPFESLSEDGATYVGLMGSVEDDKRTLSDYYLENQLMLSPTHDDDRNFQPSAIEEIKHKLMENGVVDVAYYVDDAEDSEYINPKTWAVYTSNYKLANHKVSIVGWDDTYAKENFNEKNQPPANGAWIVKNSWGTGWGNQGYFYLSYFDQSACEYTSNQVSKTKTFDNLYQYDGVGFGENAYMSNEEVFGANVFTTRNKELLDQVSVLVPLANTEVYVKVYTDWDGDDIYSGTLRSEITTSYDNAGQYTLQLKKPVLLPKGKKYAVTIEEKTDDNGTVLYTIPFESDAPEVDIVSIDVEAGETLVYSKNYWEDILVDNEEKFWGNAFIKAMTKNVTDMPDTIETTYSPTKTLNDYTDELNKNSSEKNWSWKDETIIPRVDVKEYPAVYTNKETGETSEMNVTINVAPATPVIEQAKASSIIYGDNLSKASITGTARLGNATVEGTFSWKDDTEVLSTNTKEASMIFTPKDTINYQTIEGKASIEVGKKDITIKIKDETIVYGQELPSFAYDITKGNLVGNDTLDVKLSTNANKDSKAGSYDITGIIENENYQVVIEKGILKIKPIQTEVKADSSIPSSFVNRVIITGDIKSTNGEQPQWIINKTDKDFTKVLSSNETILQAFDLALKNGTFTGALRITLPVSGDYQTVKIVHHLEKGEIDQEGKIRNEDGYDVYENVKVMDGKIQIQAYSLSPFVIVVEKNTIVSEKNDKEEIITEVVNKNTDTSDTTNLFNLISLFGVSGISLIYMYRKRKASAS